MSATTETRHRPSPPLAPKVLRWAVTAGIVLPFLWAAAGLSFSPVRLWGAFGPGGQVWIILGQMFPPDLSSQGLPALAGASGDLLRSAVTLDGSGVEAATGAMREAADTFGRSALGRTMGKVLESLHIAWIGTIIGAFFSFPLGFLAAENVSRRWVSAPVRQLLNAIRAFPELLVAFIFIPITGLGAWTGTLAIGIHSIGTLGKLSAEVVEGIDDGPVEAIEATGGGRLSQLRYGVLPQVLPTIVAYWLYRFEINIRASAVLGVVGAGGVGAELLSRLRFREFSRAGTVLLLTVVTVLVVDAISGRIRQRIITGRPVEHSVLSRLTGRLGHPRLRPTPTPPV